MRRAGWAPPLLFLVSCAACRGAAPAPVVTARAPGPPAPAREAAPARCGASVDVGELLARHARAYGSPEAVAASLPVVLSGTLALEGRTGTTEIVVAADAHRSQTSVAGLFAASGVDARGPWSLGGASGVLVRLAGVEAVSPALDAWLLRRAYVTAFDVARDTARCEDTGAGPSSGARVDLLFSRPELGAPVLAFDLESGALLSVAHTQADGKATRTTYEAWSDADHGVRWPRRSTEHPLVGSTTVHDHARVVRGLDCVRFEGQGVAIPDRGAPCTAPPQERFTLRWPAGERPRVRLPLTYLGSELLVRARLGGREVNAFLDSGAGATAVDATTPAGAELHPALELTGAGATQKLRLGFGELPSLDLGDLHAERVPTVGVPIPALDAFGDKRPELILGYSFFAAAVVRVDYKRLEVVLAKSTGGMFAKGSEPRAVPLRVLDGKLVAEGVVEGSPAPFEIDTGNGGGLDLFKRWAAARGLPGSRPVVELKGRYGAGAAETTATFYRLGTASLGPITFDEHITHVSDPPASGLLAGLAGNDVLARCDAVVFDVGKRTLWLEGTCDRPVPERRAGWRLEKRPDPSAADRPWVVSALWPDGAAQRAGVLVGDRVLEVGGKPATLDVASLWALEQQPAGTKLHVLVARNASAGASAGASAVASGRERKRLVLELRSPAAAASPP